MWRAMPMRFLQTIFLLGFFSLSILGASESRGASIIFSPTCWAGCDGSAHYYATFDGILYQQLGLRLEVSPIRDLFPQNPPQPASPPGSVWFLSGGDFKCPAGACRLHRLAPPSSTDRCVSSWLPHHSIPAQVRPAPPLWRAVTSPADNTRPFQKPA